MSPTFELHGIVYSKVGDRWPRWEFTYPDGSRFTVADSDYRQIALLEEILRLRVSAQTIDLIKSFADAK